MLIAICVYVAFGVCIVMLIALASRSAGRRRPRPAGLNDWEVQLQCPCGWHTKAPSGDEFHIIVGCCPECGRRKPVTAGKTGGDWELRIMRWTDGAWEA